MKPKITILMLVASTAAAFAQQPKWAKKAVKSVLTVKTFGADGELRGSGNAVFVTADGVAVGSFAPFVGATRAVAIDADGREWPVESIEGADGLYELVKFRVGVKKSAPLEVSADTAAAKGTLWLMPYAAKKTPTCQQGAVRRTEGVADGCHYYTIAMPAVADGVGSPLLDEEGRLVALLQPSASAKDTLSYAIDARHAAELKMSGLSINDATLRSTQVKKGLPGELGQAILTLYVAPQVLDSASYRTFLDDFIAKFPAAPDGYTARAQMEMQDGDFDKADADMAQALKVADKKDEAHFSYAKLIFQKEVYRKDKPYEKWSLDRAAEEADAAYAANALPIYHDLKAQIRFAQKRYDEAFALYDGLRTTNLRSASTFYAAAKCKELLGDSVGQLAQLDSAVACFSKPYLKEAAPYLLVRAQALTAAGKFRQAVLDYNDYEKLMPTEVNDNFYYVREQVEMEGRLFQQALDDIQRAIDKAPSVAIYHAEKASIEVRVGRYDEAAASARECVKLDPQLSDGHLFLGYALCLKGDKAAGVKSLEEAKRLGNEQADGLISKYGVKQ